jgi:hypothetical protein
MFALFPSFPLRMAHRLAALSLLAGAAQAAPFTFPIATDAFLDGRTANVGKNYGAATTVKVLINNNVTGDGSASRGLFQLPPEVDLYDPGQIASARVRFYVWQDNTADLNITLYPLTQSFAEGTGNGTAPADGATWNTCDGTNAWANAGGDYDANFPVIGVKEEILDPDMHDRFFSWDITSLLTNETARSNLLVHGALLMIDEIPLPSTGTPRAPFTSSDDLAYATAFRPHVQLSVVVRSPDLRNVSVTTNGIALDIGDCTPFITNRIERTLDLQQTNGWSFVTHWVATGTATHWMEALPPEWTRAFYRVRIAE